MKKILALVLALVMVLAVAAASAASLTIDNPTVGIVYKVYKLLDASLDTTTGSMVYYKIDGVNYTGSPFEFADADASGRELVTNDSAINIEDVKAWVAAQKDVSITAIPAAKMTGVDSDYKATGAEISLTGLTDGYYYVTSGLGTFVTIDSAGDLTTSDVTIHDKNTTEPDVPNKTITAEDSAMRNAEDWTAADVDEYVESNDAAIGTTQSFNVTFNATNRATDPVDSENKVVEYFKISDVPSNMRILANTINVVVTDADGNHAVITNGVAATGNTLTYTEADNAALNATILWASGDPLVSLYKPVDGRTDIKVTLTYNAVVLAGAATNNADNTVTVKWGRTGEDDKTVGNDTTNTTTYKFQLRKENADHEDLTGAKFQLKEGDVIVKVVPDGNNFRAATSDDETGAVETFTMLAANVIISGLDKQSTYTLTEMEAPAGYNRLTTPVDVELAKLIPVNQEFGGTYVPVTVENNKGAELPSTGGIGTTIFYIVGGLLVIGAAVILVARRKSHD